MPRIRVDLDEETYARLVEQASTERRPVPWQLEAALRRALGLPTGRPTTGDEPEGAALAEVDR